MKRKTKNISFRCKTFLLLLPQSNLSLQRMKRLIFAGIVLLSLSACTDKVAFVDNAKLLDAYKEKKDIKAKLDKDVISYQKKRDSISQAFLAEHQAFENEVKNLPTNVARKRYNELIQKKEILEKHLLEQEQNIQAETQRQLDSLINKVKKNIRAYGKKKGYTFILGANDAGSILYGTENRDITKEVSEYLNQEYEKEGKK